MFGFSWGHGLRAGGGGASVPKVIVAEGDSLTAPAGSYAELWFDDNPTVNFTNKAVGGAQIGTAALEANSLRERLASVIALAPTHVSILIGANDLGADVAGWIVKLQDYITLLRAGVAGVKVLVATLTPQPAAYNANFNGYRATANASIRAGLGTWVDEIIPLGDHPEVSSDAAVDVGVAGTYYEAAGPHPTAYTQGVLKTIYSAVMDAIIANDGDGVPQQFTFTDQLSAAINTDYTSRAVIRGIGLGASATASITGDGTFAVGLGAFNTSNKTILAGDTVTAKVTSGASIPVTKAQVMTIGGSVSDTFTVTTAVSPATATFNPATGTEKNGNLTINGSDLVCTGVASGQANCVAATQTAGSKTQWEVTITTLTGASSVFIGFFNGSTNLNGAGAVAPGQTDANGACFVGGNWGFEFHINGVNTQFNYGAEGVSGGSPTSLGRRLATGDVISVVRDDVANTISWYRTRSGTTVQLGVTETSVSDTFSTAFAGTDNSHVLTANFGQSAFARTLDSGFSVYG